MAFITKALDIQLLADGKASKRQHRLFEIWDRNNGIIRADIGAVHSHILLLGMPTSDGLPEITFVGRNSLANHLVNADWRDDLEGQDGGDAIAAGYHSAAIGDPVFEHVTHLVVRDGQPFYLDYQRSVYRFETPTGRSQMVTLSTLLDTNYLPSHPANPRSLPATHLLTSSPFSLGKGVASSLMHSLSETTYP